VPCTKIGIRLNSCDAAQAEEQRDENDQAAFCSHGMPTRPPHRGGRSMDLRQPGGQQSAARHAIRIHARANSAPVCESIRAADGTEVTESAGITTVFREHYKQLGSPLVCASSTRTTSTV
jgi:hypothetical protein